MASSLFGNKIAKRVWPPHCQCLMRERHEEQWSDSEHWMSFFLFPLSLMVGLLHSHKIPLLLIFLLPFPSLLLFPLLSRHVFAHMYACTPVQTNKRILHRIIFNSHYTLRIGMVWNASGPSFSIVAVVLSPPVSHLISWSPHFHCTFEADFWHEMEQRIPFHSLLIEVWCPNESKAIGTW